MHIDWEESVPLAAWLPKSSPARGLLEGDADLHAGGTFAFSADIAALAEPRAIATQVGERLLAWHAEAGASEASAAGVKRLLEGAAAIVTGQQTNLLGGPLLTVLKALTAVRLARECSRLAGRPFVPVFWAEAEDSDIAEINQVTTLGSDHQPLRFELPVHDAFRGGPAGRIPLGSPAVEMVERFFTASGGTEFTAELLAGVMQDLGGADHLSRWFCRQMLRLFAEEGLVVVESSDGRTKELQRSFWVRVLEDPLELTERLREAGDRLSALGYRPAIIKGRRRCPFFLINGGRREPVFFERGSFRAGERRYTPLELRRRLDEHPGDFSPSVHLRPLLQDFLLPTAAYVGGPSEVAYFLQVLPGYSWAEIPAPTVVLRASLTLLEPSVRKLLLRQEVGPWELRRGVDGVLNEAVRRENRLADPSRWTKLRESTLRPLERLGGGLSASEAELAELVRTAAGKVDYQIKDLEKRAVAALRRRSDVLRGQLTRSRSRLYPQGLLQERLLSPYFFMNKYGPDLVRALGERLPGDFTRHHFGTIIP